MAQRYLPDVPRLLEMKDRGMTDKQIAEEYGVTRQAVSLKLKGASTPRWRQRDLGWDVQSRHKQGWMYDAVSFYRISQRKERPLAKKEAQRLSSFLRLMDTNPQWIVDYDPESPEGFYFRDRRPGDPDDLIATPVAQQT